VRRLYNTAKGIMVDVVCLLSFAFFVKVLSIKDANVRTFWCKRIFEIYCVSARTVEPDGELSQFAFCRQWERSSIFRDFVLTSFMDGP